jgi:hypothetical protein
MKLNPSSEESITDSSLSTVTTMAQNKRTKTYLKKMWDECCHTYLLELAKMWGWQLSPVNDGWVGDEIGGVFCYEGEIFIDFDDIRLCVENNVSEDVFREYLDYNSKAVYLGLDSINLQSWEKGCPRVKEEDLDRLIKMKDELNEEILKTKNMKE